MTTTALDTAIGAISKRGALRTHELAELLGIAEGSVDAMLDAARADGRLITCAVELAGGRHVTEYRCSAAGVGHAPHPLRAYRPSPALLVKRETTYGRQAPAPGLDMDAIYHNRLTREEPQVNLIERAQALFMKHGPMTKRQVREHDTKVADHLKELADGATLGRLGGKTSDVIYGLPDQSAADAKPTAKDTPPRSIHRRKAKKRAARREGGGAAMRRKRTVKRAQKAFRPALAADGALLFMGAKNGDFEIDRAHGRIVVDLVRRLTGDELVATIEFVERLDKAEVGA